jgi:hypothetical protein
MTPEERAVKRAADREASARADLERAMRDARNAGITLRAISAVAGMSPEHVRRLTSAAVPLPTAEALGIDTSKDGWLAEYDRRVAEGADHA